LRATELVVLSACETGLGVVRCGDGIHGLKRAVVLAGARMQIVSLWRVDDTATQVLMSNFYAELLKNTDRVEALRRVQLSMLRGKYDEEAGRSVGFGRPAEDFPGVRHPRYWAAFTISGQQGPLPLTPPD
jgi:CHAT domain-containing protein